MNNCKSLCASLSRLAIQRMARPICLSSSSKLKSLSGLYNKPTTSFTYKPFGFSANTSFNLFSTGSLKYSAPRPSRRRLATRGGKGGAGGNRSHKKKLIPSAAKRARQSKKRRVFHKPYKSQVRTRIKKILQLLDLLGNKPDAQPEEVITIETLIEEAYSVIDKAVKAGTMHRKAGARRKSRLARRKKAVDLHHGWGTPSPDHITPNST